MITAIAIHECQQKSFYLVIWCLFLGALCCITEESLASTYYVSPTGSDSNAGSSVAPFKTIQRAANIVNAGDTVIVKDGIYTDANRDDVIVRLTRGGTSSSWITFKSENKWGAVLDGQNTAAYGWLLTDSAKYIRIENFEVKNTKQTGIHVSAGAVDPNNLYFYGNKVHDIARRQILCTDSDQGTGHSGFYTDEIASHITLDSNLLYNIGRIPGGCPTKEYHNHDHGLYIRSNYVTVINNIFYEITYGWPTLIAAGVAPKNDWTIVNNTYYGANPKQKGHINLWGTVSNVTIENNISYGPNADFIYPGTKQSDDVNVIVKNNLVYNANVITATGAGYTVSGNIMGQDPKFKNLTGRDFHLQAGSPAIDKGTYITGYTYDADGRPIVGAPDIGAYEYSDTQVTDTVAPSMPISLAATPVSSSQINLSWTASTDNVGVSGYKVYRNGSLVATVTAASYADTGLTASTAYSYKVSAFDGAGNVSAQSAVVSATTKASSSDTLAPTVPTGLKATVTSSTQINLTWTASTDNVGVSGYSVYRGTSLIANVTTAGYTDTGLAPATAYSYKVLAFDSAKNLSAQSAAVSATTKAPSSDTLAPTVPTGLKATPISSTQINLTWTASTDNVAVSGYKVYRGTSLIAATAVPSFSDVGLTASTAYSYKVLAYDAAGNASAQSVAVSATTGP
jgi:chitodextrinase